MRPLRGRDSTLAQSGSSSAKGGFSNDWKNFGKPQRNQGVREGRGRRVEGNLQERRENRFAGRNAWRADGVRHLGQLGTTLERCAARRMGNGKKKTNRTKWDKNAGGRREEGIYTNFSNAASRTRMAGRRKGCLHENQENRFALFPCGGNVLQSGHRKTNKGNLIEFEPTLTI